LFLSVRVAVSPRVVPSVILDVRGARETFLTPEEVETRTRLERPVDQFQTDPRREMSWNSYSVSGSSPL
jgi:hypothetical protein